MEETADHWGERERESEGVSNTHTHTTLPVAVCRPQFLYELRERLSLCNELVQGMEVLFIVSILLMAGTAEMLEREIWWCDLRYV